MLISVIVPVYNVEAYLRQCVDSLLRQTWQELEIILVDDGSRDSSGAICDEYAAAYDKIRVIHKANAGLGMARNTGLDCAAGEYVIFVDSDDYPEPDMVSILYRRMAECQVDMCKGGFRRFSEQGQTCYMVRYENAVYPGERARTEFYPRLIGSLPERKDSIEMCVWGAIYNMELIRRNRIRFPSERELISEDLVFNTEYMQYANGACTVSDIVYNYRINANSLTQRYRADRFEACCHLYLTMQQRLTELCYDEMTMLRLHRMFFIYIMMCISQEKRRVSGFSPAKSISNIARICSDECVRTAIKEYPVKRLGIRQQVFLNLIRWNLAPVLYLCGNLGVL